MKTLKIIDAVIEHVVNLFMMEEQTFLLNVQLCRQSGILTYSKGIISNIILQIGNYRVLIDRLITKNLSSEIVIGMMSCFWSATTLLTN